MKLKVIAIVLGIFALQACSTKKNKDLGSESISTINNKIHDIWVAIEINGNPIEKREKMPRLELNLNTMEVFGNNGCNSISGKITAVTEQKITFGPLISTRMMCEEMKVPDAFDQAMQKTVSYKHANLNLTFYDNQGKELMKFLKVD